MFSPKAFIPNCPRWLLCNSNLRAAGTINLLSLNDNVCPVGHFSNRHQIYPVEFLGHCPRLLSSEEVCSSNGP